MKQKETHTGFQPPLAEPATGRLTLTARQELALSTDQHLSVTANAGSGKTAVLVERYLRLLLQKKATVDQIVVLTFTDKAAGELRRRIAEALRAAAHEQGSENERLIAPIREQLPNAFIGTIHSFCARLLREYVIEAGVDADFGVLEGIDQRMGVAGAVGETLAAILQNDASDSFRLQLYSLLQTKGRNWVVRCITMLLEKRDQLGRLTGPGGLYSLQDKEILRRWQQTLSHQVTADLADPSLADDLERICAVEPGTLAGFKNARTTEDRGSSFLDLTKRIFRKDGKLTASFAGSSSAARALDQEATRVWRRRMAIAPMLEALLRPDTAKDKHAMLLSATRALFSATRMAIERYDQQKLAASLLDYEDLQLRMRSLLRNEHVRSALADRFRYVMVDEFQDTNFLQYELLLLLVSNFLTGNLFVVGDPKQSIYGFRNADPEVFEASRKDLLQSPVRGTAVAMDESFRPLADIAAFVNLVFSENMEDAGFQPLVCARRNDSSGNVELMLHEKNSGELSEEEMIAHRIVRMLEGGETVYDKHEHPRRVTPGDIALLIRSRTSLPELEDALVRHSIPYVVTGGIGFFQNQDLLDFYDYLRFLLDPADSVALAGILRSPFFHVSDAELFEVAVQRGEKELWEFLSSPGLSGKKFQDTARAVSILREDLIEGLKLPPAELIDRIARQTSYVPLLAGDEQGRQRLANLQKLREFVRQETGRGFVNLYDLVERLKVMIEREENEGQEEVDTPENAVRVMTVHAAKGLEFPVVMLPRLHKRFQFDLEPYLDQEYGMGFSLPGEDEAEDLNPLTAFLKERSRQKTIDEEKRILYVACTRARDILIVSGDWEAERGKVQSLNWILKGLRIDDKPSSEAVERTVEFERLSFSNGSPQRREVRHALKVRVLLPEDLSGEDPFTRQESVTRSGRPRLLIDPLIAKGAGEEVSGEMLRTYVECPHRYLVRYVLGLPPGSAEEPSLQWRATVNNLLRRKDVLSLYSLIPSARLQTILSESNPRLLRPVAASIPEGIISDALPLVYQDADGHWNFVQFAMDAGPAGAEEFVRESQHFLLEIDAWLLQRLHDARLVRGELIVAADPKLSFSFELSRADLQGTEDRIRGSVRLIQGGRFEHRAHPCPICQVYER